MKRFFLTTLFFLFLSNAPLYVDAASLYSVSYVIDPPTASVAANHTITFLAPNGIGSGTIVLDLSRVISNTGSLDFSSMDLIYKDGVGATVNANLAAVPGAGVWGAVANNTTKKITLTYPTSAGTAVAARQTVTILIGTNASGGTAQLVNTTAGSKMGSVVAGSNIGTFAVSLRSNPTLGVSGAPDQTTTQTTQTQSAPAALLPAPTPAPPLTPPLPPTPPEVKKDEPAPQPPPSLIENVVSLITNLLGGKKEEPKKLEVKTPPPSPPPIIPLGNAVHSVSGSGVDVVYDPRLALSKQARDLVSLKEGISEILDKTNTIQTDSKVFLRAFALLDSLAATIQTVKDSTQTQESKNIFTQARSQVIQAKSSLLPSQTDLSEAVKNSTRTIQELSRVQSQLETLSATQEKRKELEGMFHEIQQILLKPSLENSQKGGEAFIQTRPFLDKIENESRTRNDQIRILKNIFEEIKRDAILSGEKDLQTRTQEISPLFDSNEADIRGFVQRARTVPGDLRNTGDFQKSQIQDAVNKSAKINQDCDTLKAALTALKGTVQEVQKQKGMNGAVGTLTTKALQSLDQLQTSFQNEQNDIVLFQEKGRQVILSLTPLPKDIIRGQELLAQTQKILETLQADTVAKPMLTKKRYATLQELIQRTHYTFTLQEKMVKLFKANLQKASVLISQAIKIESSEAEKFLSLETSSKIKKQEEGGVDLSSQNADFHIEATPFSQLSQRVGEEITLNRPTGKIPVGKAFIITASVPQKSNDAVSFETREYKKNKTPFFLTQFLKNIVQTTRVYAQELSQAGGKNQKQSIASATGVNVPDYQKIIPLVYFDPPLDMTFHYTKNDIATIQEETIKLYSWDIVNEEWIQEQASLHSEDNTVIAHLSHLSIFGLFGEPIPGTEAQQVKEVSTKASLEFSISEQDLGLKDVATDTSISLLKKKFYSAPNKEFKICIPANLFQKPIKQIVLSIDKNHFPLQYQKQQDCYGGTVKAPEKKGKQAVKIKIIYADDQVQTITLELEITNEFQSQLLSTLGPFLNQLKEAALTANTNVKKTIETTQPALQTAAIATAPAVLAANSSLFSSLLNVFHYVNHFISWLLSFFGLRKKRRRSWGAVYDAAAKSPIDLAIVRLFALQSNKLVETQVTDKNGRFSFLVSPGEYRITVTKPPFVFPSVIVKGISDGEYLNIYHGGTVQVHSEQDVISLSIPLDPPAKEHVRGSGILKDTNSFLLHHSFGMLGLSFFVSFILIVYTPHAINILLFALNALFVCAQWFLFSRKEKPWGVVFDAVTSEPIALAALAIIDAHEKKLVKTRLTDYFGRFNFFAPPGEYILSVSKDSYLFPPVKSTDGTKYKNLYVGGTIEIKKNKGYAKVNIPLEKIADAQEQQQNKETPFIQEEISVIPILSQVEEPIITQSKEPLQTIKKDEEVPAQEVQTVFASPRSEESNVIVPEFEQPAALNERKTIQSTPEFTVYPRILPQQDLSKNENGEIETS